MLQKGWGVFLNHFGAEVRTRVSSIRERVNLLADADAVRKNLEEYEMLKNRIEPYKSLDFWSETRL